PKFLSEFPAAHAGPQPGYFIPTWSRIYRMTIQMTSRELPRPPASPPSRFLRHLCSAVLLCGLALAPPLAAQDWFRTGTGLGVEKARVAVADFAPRSDSAQPLANLFSEVLRADLDYSGILELVSKSFYPLQAPSVPTELKHQAWSDPPASAH